MEFPEYSQFLLSLDSKTVADIMKDGQVSVRIASQKSEDPAAIVATQSFQIALSLLGAYHTWLRACLEKENSPDC